MSIYLIANQDLFPPNLLGYIDPTDFYSYKGILQPDGSYKAYKNFAELVSHVTKRREANSYQPIPHLEEIIQHYLYQVTTNKSLFQRLDHTEVPASYPRTFIQDVRTGANLALSLSRQALTGKFEAGARGWATKKEANERAEACYNCPNNVKLQKSLMQKVNNKLAALFTPLRTTDYDDNLFDCKVCGCPNHIKVHYAEDTIRESTPITIKSQSFPEAFVGIHDKRHHECWLKKVLAKRDNEQSIRSQKQRSR